MLDWGRFSLLVKSRQIGASHTYAAAAVLWAMLGETTTVISIGEREAIEFLEKVKLHATALAELGSSWARPVSVSRTVVNLASGGRVIALPATSGGRSYSGNVILDEFAYHQHPEKVWDGAGGTVMHGFRLRVMSTPNGIGNLFYHLCTDPKAREGYRLHEVTIEEALSQGLKVNVEDCWKQARNDPRVFDQLFRCKFIDNEQQYIQSHLLDQACVDERPALDGPVYAGLDIGRSADLTALVIVQFDSNNVAWVTHVEVCKRTSAGDLHRLASYAVACGATRVCVDSTGMGSFPAEELQRKLGRTRIEPVAFTMQSKESLATGLYQHFVDRTIRLPRANTELRDDLAALRRVITSAGNVRYEAPHTERGHSDRAWALALALHGAAGPDRRKYVVGAYDQDDDY